MHVWSFQYIDVLRGQYIYKKSFSTETTAFDEFKGQVYVQLFSGVMIKH